MTQIENSVCISHWDKFVRVLAARGNWLGGSSYSHPCLVTMRAEGINILLHNYSPFVENQCAKDNIPIGRFQFPLFFTILSYWNEFPVQSLSKEISICLNMSSDGNLIASQRRKSASLFTTSNGYTVLLVIKLKFAFQKRVHSFR